MLPPAIDRHRPFPRALANCHVQGVGGLYWGFVPFLAESFPYDTTELGTYSQLHDWRWVSVGQSFLGGCAQRKCTLVCVSGMLCCARHMSVVLPLLLACARKLLALRLCVLLFACARCLCLQEGGTTKGRRHQPTHIASTRPGVLRQQDVGCSLTLNVRCQVTCNDLGIGYLAGFRSCVLNNLLSSVLCPTPLHHLVIHAALHNVGLGPSHRCCSGCCVCAGVDAAGCCQDLHANARGSGGSSGARLGRTDGSILADRCVLCGLLVLLVAVLLA